MTRILLLAPLLLALGIPAQAATFTYRGHLQELGEPAEGSYDLRLVLYADRSGLQPLTAAVHLTDVAVRRGDFAVAVEFPDAPAVAQSGWLEVAVRAPGAGDYWPLPERRLVALKTQVCPESWALAGNAGTDANTSFVGTTDDQPLVLRARNQRVARFEAVEVLGFATGYVANVMLGSPGNAVDPGVRGAFVAGGGPEAPVNDPNLHPAEPNHAASSYGTIGGGAGNSVGGGGGTHITEAYATVGGGQRNRARGRHSTIAGGQDNRAFGERSAIGGGDSNEASARYATVAGGNGNHALADWSSVSGGADNFAEGEASAIGGGTQNITAGSASLVGGGESNQALAFYSAVLGGRENTVLGDFGAVHGGHLNQSMGFASAVASGQLNCAGAPFSWAGGRQAKVRPASAPEFGACTELPVYPGGSGDHGSFVWADAQQLDFVSSGANQFLVRAAGGMGIGTNAPQNQLHVVKSINGVGFAQNHVVQFENPSTGTSPDVLALKVGAMNPGAGVNFITFLLGDGNSAGSIEGNGSGGVSFMGPGNDFAEYLPRRDAGEQIEPGDVLGLRDGKLGRDTRGAQQIFVASSSPIIAGNDPGHSQRGHYVLAAMLGQVQLSVNGDAAPGDLLLPSGLGDGRARAVAVDAELDANQRAQVFGQVLAREDRSEGITRVRALVGQGARELANAQALARIDAENARLREALAALRIEQARQLDEVRQVVLALQSEIRGKAVLAQRD